MDGQHNGQTYVSYWQYVDFVDISSKHEARARNWGSCALDLTESKHSDTFEHSSVGDDVLMVDW